MNIRQFSPRIIALLMIFILLVLAKYCMSLGISPITHQSAHLYDLGHQLVPSLREVLGVKTASLIWWIGSMSIEVAVTAVIFSILFLGRGLLLGIALSLCLFLHGLLWHITVLPIPPDIVWTFPFPSNQVPMPNDFWFSGHVANALLLSMFYRGNNRLVTLLGWVYIAFIVLLVLSTRTHYSIDIVGAFFVAYTVKAFVSKPALSHALYYFSSRNHLVSDVSPNSPG